MKILSLHGDHYQMGLQHGRQVSDLRPLILTTIGARLEALTRTGGLDATVVDELQRAWESEPDARATTMMMHGIADALEIPRARLFQYVAASYLEDLLLAKTQPEGCTVWAASRSATREGIPILAKNRDFYEAHIPMRVIAYAVPHAGYRYIYATSAGSPGVYSSGMNERGLAIADTHVSSRDLGPGLARFTLMMNILERCASTADALAYLKSVRCMGAGNLVLADAAGECAVVENGFRACGFITPLEDSVVATNHFVSAELRDANVFRNSTTYDETRARYATARVLLDQARGAIDIASAKRVAAHHAATALCRHRPLNDADTISAAIYLPAQRRLLFCNGWPCQGSYETYRLLTEDEGRKTEDEGRRMAVCGRPSEIALAQETGMEIDTLVLAIVQRDDADATIVALTRAGFAVTVLASVGGFLGAHNVTLLIGLRASEVERARAVLQETCHRRAIHAPVETSIGGATLFVCPVARYVHLGADRVVVDCARAPVEPGALQLILAIVAREQSNQLIATLTDWSYHVTMLGTTGGYSHRANTTLLIAVRAERVDSIVEQVRRICEIREQPMATIFVLNIARLEHL